MSNALHSDERLHVTQEPSAAHNLAAVTVVSDGGIALDGREGRGARPLLEDPDVIGYTVTFPIVTHDVARANVCPSNSPKTEVTRTGRTYDERDKRESRSEFECCLTASIHETPRYEHCTPGTDDTVREGILYSVRAGRRFLSPDLTLGDIERLNPDIRCPGRSSLAEPMPAPQLVERGQRAALSDERVEALIVLAVQTLARETKEVPGSVASRRCLSPEDSIRLTRMEILEFTLTPTM